MTLLSVVTGAPLPHFVGECEFTSCAHCSRCGCGPQARLTYTWTSHKIDSAPPPGAEGLCDACAGIGNVAAALEALEAVKRLGECRL